ncbi:hypothetical protein KQR54_26150 [Mycobacterium gordonae]|uniref:hypothetical protein n=1 Tax=Mycobacterium gordonae TaxID=1778 RepID=UPI00210CBF3D|nr:hypothetical protein [Mycobacterium gordonae]MCQ4364565.1 hypothetical protein [Mycobacterium gordonae]
MSNLYDPVVMTTVYCEGPHGNPHPRREIETYRRLELQRKDGILIAWFPVPGDGHGAHRDIVGGDDGPSLVANITSPDYRSKVRFHCNDCDYDEKRDTGKAIVGVFAPMSDLFELLHAHGKHDIAVRELVRRVWPQATGI